ncbi:MAG: NUDIX hydrolase [Bacteroidales bacterium]
MLQFVEIKEGDINKRAGIIVTDLKMILGCLPTPTPKYPNLERKLDLSKGHMEVGELPIESAIRETAEETGLLFEKQEIVFVKEFVLYDAPFYVYIAVLRELPPIEKLVCRSTFSTNVINQPENSDFLYVPIEDVSTKFFPELVPIILQSINHVRS